MKAILGERNKKAGTDVSEKEMAIVTRQVIIPLCVLYSYICQFIYVFYFIHSNLTHEQIVIEILSIKYN